MRSEIYIAAAELMDYDKDTGILSWKNPDDANNKRKHKHVGSTYSDGYMYVKFSGISLLVHRLVWLKVNGVLPNGCIDHINMNRSDNRICNIRIASFSENSRNRKAQSNNTSGYKGVTFHKSTGKFHARICVDGRRISLGYFVSVEDAAIVYQKAAKEYHGEYARFN
jgi:hypothetical protein